VLNNPSSVRRAHGAIIRRACWTNRQWDDDEEGGEQHGETDGIWLVTISYRLIVAEETAPHWPHSDV